jgi:hypothetical protein
MSTRAPSDLGVGVDRTPPNQSRRWSRPPREWVGRRSIRPRSGWHAYRPVLGASVPDWAVELALTIERPLARTLDGLPQPRVLLLARAAGWWQPIAHAVGDALRGVDRIAGTSPPLPSVRLVPPHPEVGLEAIAHSVVMAHLRLGSERGHTTGYRRARSHRARVAIWEAGTGAVLTCRSQAGASLQAVIAIRDHGDPISLRPPPGGATVLRAWRCPGRGRRHPTGRGMEEADAEWALTTGVVLASTAGSGLGRAARRYAVQAETAGWNTSVLTGAAALALARAADPRHPPPTTVARRASNETVLAMLTSCLAASANQIDRPALPRP